MRLQISLIALLCLCFTVSGQEHAPVPLHDEAGCRIVLEGNNAVQMPGASFSSINATWTYPFSVFPIYADNESISGSILCPSSLAGSEVGIYVSRFNLFDLLSDSLSQNNGTQAESVSQARLNTTGDGNFVLDGVPGGLYAIKAFDASNTSVLAITPALIAKGEIAMDYPSQIKAGDILPVNVTTTRAGGNISKIYGAIMIYGEDYATAEINLTANDTVESLFTTISIGNRSMQVQGMPSVSTEMLMNLLTILPENSTLAAPMQGSTAENAKLYLLTDPALPKGEYILTCAVYSPGSGLMGLRQATIEVV